MCLNIKLIIYGMTHDLIISLSCLSSLAWCARNGQDLTHDDNDSRFEPVLQHVHGTNEALERASTINPWLIVRHTSHRMRQSQAQVISTGENQVAHAAEATSAAECAPQSFT